MAKFVVGSTIVDVTPHNCSIRDEDPSFHVSDGKDEWYASGELIVESYTPIDIDAEHYYKTLNDEYD